MKYTVFLFGILLATTGCDKAKMSYSEKSTSPQNEKATDNGKKDNENGGSDSNCQDFSVQTIAAYNREGKLLSFATPWEGRLSVSENYNYSNNGANVIIGTKGEAKEAAHFFYRNDNGLFLFLIYDRPHDFTGNAYVNVDLQTEGNELLDSVQLSDEDLEMAVVETNAQLKTRTYLGNFEYQKVGDGAVIGPFSGDTWSISVKYHRMSEIDKIYFADSEFGGTQYMLSSSVGPQDFTMVPEVRGYCEMQRAFQ